MFEHTNDDTLLTIDELCERLFISQTSAYRLLQSGEIAAFKIGTWKIPVKSVKAYIQKRLDEQRT